LCDLPEAKVLQSFLPMVAFGALTSCRRTDKNAHFLRQAVSFASRNGRSAILCWKRSCRKISAFDGIVNTQGLDE
jgi:hypothetical protein